MPPDPGSSGGGGCGGVPCIDAPWSEDVVEFQSLGDNGLITNPMANSIKLFNL